MAENDCQGEDPIGMLNRLRDQGWAVAVHNDYWLAGERYTFWLFTHRDGRWIKGEGRTDAEALAKASADAETLLSLSQERDRLREALEPFIKHHAPWMNEWSDELECTTYSRHTFGDLRRARAALNKEPPCQET